MQSNTNNGLTRQKLRKLKQINKNIIIIPIIQKIGNLKINIFPI